MTNQYGRWVPDSLSPSGFRWQRHDEVPATTMLPIIQPHHGTVEYVGHHDHVLPAPVELADVPPRVDDWCENRAPGDLTDEDGRD